MAKRRKAKRTEADQRSATTIEQRSGASDPTAFAITTEPLPEPGYAALSRATKTELERLYQLARTNPRAAAPQLMAALLRYPQVPSIFNYLFVAFSAMGDIKRAEAIVLENLRLHPDYLFARVNYAEMCLGRGEPDKVPEILGEQLDLKQLYPERDRFHVSARDSRRAARSEAALSRTRPLSRQCPCPFGAQRTMKMCYSDAHWLAQRSKNTWCCEPERQWDLDVCRHNQLWYLAMARKHVG